MESLSGENLHARKKRMIVELLKGKEMAIQLQTLLRMQSTGKARDLVSAEELSLQILRSFGNTLSELSSCAASTESTQIPAVVDCGQRRKKPAGTKNRRGCYKRRMTSDSWTVESSTTEDGFAWRKYGQKLIMDSNHPRSYYRCTHKYKGCKAIKQVQVIKEKPNLLYQTTYISHHSCSKTMRGYSSHLSLSPSDFLEPKNLFSFQTKRDNDDDDDDVNNPVNSEEHSGVRTSVGVLSEANSSNTGLAQKDDLVGLEDEMDFGLQYYGMEMDDGNQFDNLLFSFDDDQM